MFLGEEKLTRKRYAYCVVMISHRVAIKYMNHVFNNRDDALRTLREISILRQCHHPNLNKIMDAYIPQTKDSYNSVWTVLVLVMLHTQA